MVWAAFLGCAALGGEANEIERSPKGQPQRDPGDSTLVAGPGNQPRRGPTGQPNLCAVPDLVVAGTVTGRESAMVYAPRQFGPQQIIMTTVTFEVEATLRGGARVGGEVEIPVLGGEYGRTGEIVEGSPRVPLGGRYLLFLQTEPELDAKGRTPDYWLPVLAFFVLPPRKGTPRLPASRDLAAVLEATCAAHPEGIYWGQQVKLVVPSEVIGRNRSDAFEKLVLPHPGGLPRSASVEE